MPSLKEVLGAYRKGYDHLASTSAVPESRIREIAAGADPYLSELRALGAALRISVADLAPLSESTAKADFLFRAAVQRKHGSAGVAAESLSRRMASSLDVLRVAADQSGWTTDFSEQERADPEAAAFKVREVFYKGDQLSPLNSLPQLIVDRLQILLFVVNTSEFEGASAILDGVPFIFLAARYSARMLFTCAHELGHILLHHDSHASFAEIDIGGETDGRRSGDQKERFAHAFASALLLPKAGVGIVLKKLREVKKLPLDSPVGDVELLYLARIYGVSFAAAARRCEDLQLLPRGGANSLDQKLKEDFESAEKRAEQLGLPPRASISFPVLPATLLKKAAQRVRNGELSIGRASMMLGLSISDFLAANAPLYQ